jgi:thioredoxin reductase
MNSNVKEIRADSVVIEVGGKAGTLPNDGIIVCAGGILPTGFLKDVGIEVETKYGSA